MLWYLVYGISICTKKNCYGKVKIAKSVFWARKEVHPIRAGLREVALSQGISREKLIDRPVHYLFEWQCVNVWGKHLRHSTGTKVHKLVEGNSLGQASIDHRPFAELFSAEIFPIGGHFFETTWVFLEPIPGTFQCLRWLPNKLQEEMEYISRQKHRRQ